MRLTTVTNVSLDGVTQGHRRIEVETRGDAGTPDEDGGGGFERFGWARRCSATRPLRSSARLSSAPTRFQIVLLAYPVVVGQGARLFPATGSDIGLELVDLRSTPEGLTIQTYRTTGRPRCETAT